mmetsp:Transcript_12372/g.29060  ORF Transcript_12372/g.29060 Transcript_12372/m.29060 type:complete len:239 (-) Transcript_12372:446-1162(-)
MSRGITGGVAPPAAGPLGLEAGASAPGLLPPPAAAGSFAAAAGSLSPIFPSLDSSAVSSLDSSTQFAASPAAFGAAAGASSAAPKDAFESVSMKSLASSARVSGSRLMRKKEAQASVAMAALPPHSWDVTQFNRFRVKIVLTLVAMIAVTKELAAECPERKEPSDATEAASSSCGAASVGIAADPPPASRLASERSSTAEARYKTSFVRVVRWVVVVAQAFAMSHRICWALRIFCSAE